MRLPIGNLRAVSCVAVLIAAIARTAAAANSPVQVELRADAEVAQARVVLADVALIRGADAAVREQLGALVVGEVSSNGATTVVERATLARWVQTRMGAHRVSLAWSGGERCRVRLAATPPHGAPAASVPLASAGAPTASLVGKGRFATLHSNAGAITLESRVEVLQDGALGQEVHVRLPGATDSIVARVAGPEQVEVNP